MAEGYIRDPFDVCETATMMGKPGSLGAMGIHFFRPDMLGVTEPPNPRVRGTGTHTDFRHPSVLLYEPHADGSLTLVGVDRDNPNGVFAPFNPAVSCAHHKGGSHMHEGHDTANHP